LLVFINSFNLAAPSRPAEYGIENWILAFTSPGTLGALWNSIALGVVRIVLSMPITIVLAWLISRTDMPGRSTLEMLCWTAIFLPTLPLTFGWILLLDPRYGIANVALQKLLSMEVGPLNIYSFWGIVWVHLASTTVAYSVIVLLPAFRRIGAPVEEAARVCGANQIVTCMRITLPLLAPAIISVTILTFVRSLEVFEVELLLGRPAGISVYSTRIYDLVRDSPPLYGQATALGFIFLVVMVILALLYQGYLNGKSFTVITGQGYSSTPVRLLGWRRCAAVFCFGWFAVTLATPLFFLVVGSFMRRYGFFYVANPFTLYHWRALFSDPLFFSSLRNSLIIAFAVAIIGIILYSLVAYAILRSRSGVARVTDILVWVPWGMPGILMSLGLLWLFLSTPLRTLLYGGLAGIVLAIVIKDSPIGTQFFKAGFLQVGSELEESARVCGASWLRTYWRVLLPLVAPTAITVGLLNFLSSMRDISTSVLLYSSASRSLSILMLEYSFAGEMERSTAVGVLITIFVLIVTLCVRALGFRFTRERP
jgi:iron(III) transport system permease protein